VTAPLRAVIVDDEPLARERIRTLLAADGAVTVVAECGDGAGAVDTIRRDTPELVFLDIQMPEMDGFEVLAALHPARLPAVIFVTAYDDYALRAFDVHAVDYVMKPLDPERFRTALARARERLRAGPAGADERLVALLAQLASDRRAPARFVVRHADRISFVRAEDVDWIEAAGNYARLHTTAGTHLVRETMKALDARLDPERFVRVHRSIIVNVERIASLEPWFHGEFTVTMQGGARFTSSRSHSDRLRRLIR